MDSIKEKWQKCAAAQHVFNECNIPVAQCYTKETQQFSNLFRFLLFSEIKAKFHQLIDDKLSFVQKKQHNQTDVKRRKLLIIHEDVSKLIELSDKPSLRMQVC